MAEQLVQLVKDLLIDLTVVFPKDTQLFFMINTLETIDESCKKDIYKDACTCLSVPGVRQALDAQNIHYFLTLDVAALDLDLVFGQYFNILDSIREIEKVFDQLDAEQKEIVWDYIDLILEQIWIFFSTIRLDESK